MSTRHVELDPSAGSANEVFAHSQFRNAWNAPQPNPEHHFPVNWNITPGAHLDLLLVLAADMARLRNGETPTWFFIHGLQNSISHGVDFNIIYQQVLDFEHLIYKELGGFHNVIWVNCDRAPELYGHWDNIAELNRRLDVLNISHGFRSCYPGRVLEKEKKKKRYKLIVQERRWREEPGYHVSDDAFPVYIQYMRRYIDHNGAWRPI